MRITTVLQVKGLKESARAIIQKHTEKGTASLLPQPALEEKAPPPSQKMKQRIYAKSFGYLSCNY